MLFVYIFFSPPILRHSFRVELLPVMCRQSALLTLRMPSLERNIAATFRTRRLSKTKISLRILYFEIINKLCIAPIHRIRRSDCIPVEPDHFLYGFQKERKRFASQRNRLSLIYERACVDPLSWRRTSHPSPTRLGLRLSLSMRTLSINISAISPHAPLTNWQFQDI